MMQSVAEAGAMEEVAEALEVAALLEEPVGAV